MENDEFVKCPLCDGLAKMRRTELQALLTGNNLREKLEKNAPEFAPMHRPKPGEFGNGVHHWNPNLPLWNRSPKE
jgi:hypothetical protein